ncbi:MAG TPA: insulinase family protein [Spirochaetes bacterium]|nr:insulinase family protein [Spirochaetota bacterium]
MKLFRIRMFVLFAVLILAVYGGSQAAWGMGERESVGEALPVDPEVIIGKLENGLTYYIRENKKPENVAVLRLVVDAGSVVEEDDEQGLAHFVEHLAFNGTANFKKTDIIDYLESIGIRYGPEVNASTGFDETIYKLEVPTDNEEAVVKGFQILADWAHLVSFEEDEVDRERGIIIEEWRQRSGAGMRVMEKHYQVLYRGSKYAGRMPIGKQTVIESVSAEKLKNFYKKWYPPDNMAVIAVGDFKAEAVEDLIKKSFSMIPESEGPWERPFFPVPDHQETLYSVAVDPEIRESRVTIYIKKDVRESKTRADYRKSIVEYLFSGMLNSRFDEMSKKPDPAFISAAIGGGLIIRTKEAVVLSATVQHDGIERGLLSILVETRRAIEFGFTASELEREKKNLLSWIEQAYKERENTPSHSHVREYIRNFLEDEPIPGIKKEYELFSAFVPGVTLEEVNRAAEDWIGEKNRVVLVTTPGKPADGAQGGAPDEEDLKRVFERAGRATITPYEDSVKEGPLLAEIPAPGSIVEEIFIDSVQTTRLVLSNGAVVLLKPTDFKEDEILFEAMSPGGHSLLEDEEYIAAITAPTAIKDSGVGDFSKIELEKELAGKVAAVSPWISEIYEGFSGSSSAQDLEILFKLVYLYFTDPGRDPDAFQAYRERLRARFENRRSIPDEVFWDTVRTTIGQDHFRSRPLTVETLDEMDLDRSHRIFRERFSDAGDFTFIFVGSFDVETIKPLVLTYLGGLPSGGNTEKWRDLGIDPPGGVVQKTVRMGIESRSQVLIGFSGPFSWSYEGDFSLEAMGEVLDIRLREKVREEQSGTYGIWVWASTRKYPDNEYTVYIGFGCDPDRVEELTDVVFKEIDWIREGEIDSMYLTKVKEIFKRGLEKSLKENGYWLKSMALALRRGEDPGIIVKRAALIDRLDADIIGKAARSFLTPGRYIRVVLYPQAEE